MPLGRIKNFGFRVAAGTGMLSLVGNSKWRRERLLILCYHGVSVLDEHEWNPSLYVSQEHLRRRLAWLRAHGFAILPLRGALDDLATGNLPPRAVAITFDDGAQDFTERAVPVLREYDAPATVYLTTYYCERRYPVFDTALSYLLWKGRSSGADLGVVLGDGPSPVLVDTPAGRQQAWSLFQEFSRRQELSAHEKNELLREVATELGLCFSSFVDSGLLQLMRPDQVRCLPRDLVDVQLHTHRHRTPRERPAFIRELEENQRSIVAFTGDVTRRSHFCYPSGDYDGRFLPWLREFGVETATTCVPGLASRRSDRLLLPRFIDTMHVAPHTFAAWASGVAAMAPRRAVYRLDRKRVRATPSEI